MVVEGYVKPNARTLDESLYGNDYIFCHFEVNFCITFPHWRPNDPSTYSLYNSPILHYPNSGINLHGLLTEIFCV